MNFSQTYKTIENSVVMVSFGYLFNNRFNQQSVGTGVVVLDGKHVLTCAHCTSQQPGISNGIVDMQNNHYKVGTIKYINPNLDIALLEFSEIIGSPAKVVDSGNMQIGEECFTVGFPNAILQKTFLSAHIAASSTKQLILDCPVNHGNSGGPLFNVNGAVVGIVNAKHGGISAVLEDLLKHKLKASKGGVFISGVDPLAVFEEILTGMKKNLNLGIGYAVKTSEIKCVIPNIY